MRPSRCAMTIASGTDSRSEKSTPSGCSAGGTRPTLRIEPPNEEGPSIEGLVPGRGDERARRCTRGAASGRTAIDEREPSHHAPRRSAGGAPMTLDLTCQSCDTSFELEVAEL